MTTKKKEIDFTVKRQFAFKFMYIGRNYEGLVIQSSTHNTVEETIFAALKRCALVEDKPIEILMSELNYSRCGRTDKGVNSTGNVFCLLLRYNPSYDYAKTINNLLPNDIYIVNCIQVDDSFDARFSCLYREYKYYFLRKGMNISIMNQAAHFLQGIHNFKRFCKIDKSDQNYENKCYMRRIYEIGIERVDQVSYPYKETQSDSGNDYYEMYVCVIKGSAFLWHQVRCMMGILFLIGNQQEEIGIVKEMLDMSNSFDFRYMIADDANLVLTDCVYEFYDFDMNSIEIASDNYFKLEEVYQRNLVQVAINTHFFNVINGSNRKLMKMTNDEMVIFFEKNHRRKAKYTKMLQHKTNRGNKKK